MSKKFLLFIIVFFSFSLLFILPSVEAQQEHGQTGRPDFVESETAEVEKAEDVDGTEEPLLIAPNPEKLKESDNSAPSLIRSKLRNRLDEIAEKQLEFKQQLQEKHEAKKQELVQKRSEFRKKVMEIKDEQKQKILEKIETKLNEINTRLVEHLLSKVENLQTYLSRLEEKTADLVEIGGNVDDVYTQISNIQDQIDDFKLDLAAQAEKDYVPEITTESNLKQDVGEIHQALRDDIKSLRDTLVQIHLQVQDTVQLVISLHQLLVSPTP